MRNLRLVSSKPKLQRAIGTSVPYIAPAKMPLVFAREQSLASRGMEWEGRVRPLLPWSTLILRGLGAAVVAGLILWAVL